MKSFKISTILMGVVFLIAGCNTDIANGDINLKTTCFPYGLEYEWTYVRDSYDTFTVTVADSNWESDTLVFTLDIESNPGYPPRILDVDESIKMVDNLILIDISGRESYSGTINLESGKIKTGEGFSTDFNNDTLVISAEVDWTDWCEAQIIIRKKGIGTVIQEYYYSDKEEGGANIYVRDSLITFTTPKGQIYP